MSAPSEMRVLIAAIRANGFKVVRTGGGAHQKVLTKSGQVVTDANGPLILSGSPSEHRWREMHVNRLMKANVLKSDPWKATGKDGAKPGEPDEAHDGETEQERQKRLAKEREDARLRDRSEAFRLRTQTLRSGIEPIVSKLGGWSRGGSGIKVADFAAVIRYWAEQNDPEVIPVATSGVPFQQSAWVTQTTNLRTAGGTVSERWLPVFEAFLVALREGNENLEPRESSLVFMDILRASKGILPVPTDDDQPVDADPFPEPVASSTVVVEWPRVALEALFWMSRGADGHDRDTILDLAEEIAEMAATNEERKER